jgi:hypothetical protein
MLVPYYVKAIGRRATPQPDEPERTGKPGRRRTRRGAYPYPGSGNDETNDDKGAVVMRLRRRVSQDIEERLAADRRLAARYDDLLARVGTTDQALRHAEAEGRRGPESHALVVALDKALTEALVACEAAERVAMGPATYSPADGSPDEVRAAEIARRKARAKPAVRPWTEEVDRLRTAREKHRLSFRVGRDLAAPS